MTTVNAVHVIQSDGEALEKASELADAFAAGADDRDAQRRIPFAELDMLSESGLLGITVPQEFGGADVSAETVTDVFRRLAAADPSIAQIPQSHFVYVNALRENASPSQQDFFFAEILSGRRLGNAQAEARSRTAQDVVTRLTPSGEGDFFLDGAKKYATGALLAHWIPVLAKDEQDLTQVAYVRADSPGVTVTDDWDGMGQRTTASGSVRLQRVRVAAEHVVAHHPTFDRPQVYGAFAQILHAAIDVGIARAALEDAAEFVRDRSRPWAESGAATAAEDVLTIQRFGELAVDVQAAEALLRSAAESIDRARSSLSDRSAAEASIAVAGAKAFGGNSAVRISSALFEVAGTSASLNQHNLHRHWRNARTHSLHDPVRWKYQHIGRYVLHDTFPPRHGQI